MTKNRRRKLEIREHQAATGTTFLQARREITMPTLAEIMKQEPLLCAQGIGLSNLTRAATREERRAELAAQRERLAGREDGVAATVAWLRANIDPIKTPKADSYPTKHVMERHIGLYVMNGEFIAAAMIAGYPHQFIPHSINVLFGMSARSLKRVDPVRQRS